MSLRPLARVGLVLMGLLAAAAAHRAATGTASAALVVAGSIALTLCTPAAPILALRWLRPRTSALMLISRRALARTAGDPASLSYQWVDLDRVAVAMCRAAVAAEDASFLHHPGFDWPSIRAARAHNRTGAPKRGASTITQQVAKNLFLWPSRTHLRKTLEAYLTVLLEALWSKRRILEVYLNIAQFGENVFGVQAAALRYFGKPAADLSPQQAALLAAVLPNPLVSCVRRPSHRLRLRQVMVLSAMEHLGALRLEDV